MTRQAWKLVPVEASENMTAGHRGRELTRITRSTEKRIYKAMLSAAPPIPDEIVEAMALAIFDDLRGRSGIKHLILHHEGIPHEAGFEDNKFWLIETARAALNAIQAQGVG